LAVLFNELHGDMKSESCDYVRVLNAELQYVSIEVTRGARFDISGFNKQLNEVIRDALAPIKSFIRHFSFASSSATSKSSFFSTNIYYTYFKSNAATSF
jgi:hypothetical protein